MGFYFRVAPGLKLRVTRGGLRIGVGPRAARLHLGAGGTGVSTGAGPWTYYQPLRTGQSRSGGTRRASSGFPTAADQKRAEAESISTELTRLLDLHREEFPAAAPPVVAPVAPTPLSEFTKRRRKQELAGIGFWRWSARRQARARAAADAQQDLAQEQARLDADRARAQQDADQWWQRLHVNDEDTVLDAVNTAFEDNEAPAVAVSVNGAEIELAVLVPDIDVVPERMPGVTDAGNLSLRRMRAGDRTSLYTDVVMGFVIASIREALATAPAISSARLVALRLQRIDAYGEPRLECLVVGRWAREAFEDIRWDEADATSVAQDSAMEIITRTGAGRGLQPIDLADHPEIAAAMAQMDLSELTLEST